MLLPRAVLAFEAGAALERAALQSAALQSPALERPALQRAALERAALQSAALERAALQHAALQLPGLDLLALLHIRSLLFGCHLSLPPIWSRPGAPGSVAAWRSATGWPNRRPARKFIEAAVSGS